MKISPKELSLERKRKSHVVLPYLKQQTTSKRYESCLARVRQNPSNQPRLEPKKWQQLNTLTQKLDNPLTVPRAYPKISPYGSIHENSQYNSRNTTLYQPRSTNTLLKAKLPDDY